MTSITDAIKSTKCDTFFYWGPIAKSGYQDLSTAIEKRETRHESTCLVLATYGGDPDAGFRIARALNHHYKKVTVLIPDVCKSAGTLVCIGAHELIFGDRGELGPLDIQISKPDEMFESMSGLDILQALNALQNQVLNSFRSYLVDIRTGSRISTKMAAEIAVKLTEGYIAPIAGKIDPVTLGEHQRAVQIAYDYGERLSAKTNSLQKDALVKLVSSYPSHSFVIDRKEARGLFNCISSPTDEMLEVYKWARSIIETKTWPNNPLVVDLEVIFSEGKEYEDKSCCDDKESNQHQPSEDEGRIDGFASPEGDHDESDVDTSNTNENGKDRESSAQQSVEPDCENVGGAEAVRLGGAAG